MIMDEKIHQGPQNNNYYKDYNFEKLKLNWTHNQDACLKLVITIMSENKTLKVLVCIWEMKDRDIALLSGLF